MLLPKVTYKTLKKKLENGSLMKNNSRNNIRYQLIILIIIIIITTTMPNYDYLFYRVNLKQII